MAGIFENLLILSFWALTGTQTALVCRNTVQKAEKKKNPLILAAAVMASVIIGIVLILLFPPADGQASFGDTDWSAPQTGVIQNEEAADGFVLIQGSSFLMGSPDTENWRLDDETQHEVTVAPFFMDPYETTQGEYIRLMGENPSMFTGDNLPVENISWPDAVRYANEKSTDAGLMPVYVIAEDGVTWDLSADGYRLPTEAEWEYACRAGTTTPFNTEKSLSAAEANFYGHYPYEIEENYFNNSVLKRSPVNTGRRPLLSGVLNRIHGASMTCMET